MIRAIVEGMDSETGKYSGADILEEYQDDDGALAQIDIEQEARTRLNAIIDDHGLPSSLRTMNYPHGERFSLVAISKDGENAFFSIKIEVSGE